MSKRPGARGWAGRGGGRITYVQPHDEWRGTTVQTCGLWPFAAGTGSPLVGVPLGRNLLSPLGETVCADPISWFQRAGLILNPSEFVLGLPGLGKSSVVRRQVAGLAGFGVIPLVLGDLKPDYVDLIRALGGPVMPVGIGRGSINILDASDAHAAADRLTGTARAGVIGDALSRRVTLTSALITVLRSSTPDDREETILSRAVQVLDDRHHGVPVIEDLLQVIKDGPEEVRQVAIDRGSVERYRQLTESLEVSLTGLLPGGRFGDVFSRQTTTPLRVDRPAVFDVSSIDDSQGDLQAAVLLACWSAGFGAINVANELAAAGVGPQRHYFAVLDELWRALGAGRGMVDKIDALTRLNRNEGVGQAMITHTMSDLVLPDPADTAKAKGFVERAGMVLCGGLPASEMALLRSAVRISQAEEQLLTSWQDPPSWDPVRGRQSAPVGRGKFLIKVGNQPGIPFHMRLTDVERRLGVHDTNKRWHAASRISAGELAPA